MGVFKYVKRIFNFYGKGKHKYFYTISGKARSGRKTKIIKEAKSVRSKSIPFVKEILRGRKVSDIGQFPTETMKELTRLVRKGKVLKVKGAGPFPKPKTVYVGLMGRSPKRMKRLVELERKKSLEKLLR